MNEYLNIKTNYGELYIRFDSINSIECLSNVILISFGNKIKKIETSLEEMERIVTEVSRNVNKYVKSRLMLYVLDNVISIETTPDCIKLIWKDGSTSSNIPINMFDRIKSELSS